MPGAPTPRETKESKCSHLFPSTRESRNPSPSPQMTQKVLLRQIEISTGGMLSHQRCRVDSICTHRLANTFVFEH